MTASIAKLVPVSMIFVVIGVDRIITACACRVVASCVGASRSIVLNP
jgi:hypothetical protein